MCGIAGILYSDRDRPVDRAVLQAMADSIAHRGPDAEGFWIGPGIGIAHRRLSIIDLSAGAQPMPNEDGSIQVVFNGEIYNFRQLRAELKRRGHQLRTQSDTEVLVHLYEDEGQHLVDRLRGMFAFALWDHREGRLLLARDRVGIKPLYVYRDQEKLLFGSELKAILAFPGIARDIDHEALEDYLAFGSVAGARSIFRGIEKLPAAHTLLVDRSSLRRSARRYWRLQFEPDRRPAPEEWQEAIRAKISEAVQGHLIADVPVGAFLSGGIDSSVVVTTAAAHVPDTIQTFSIGFHDDSISELPYAREVAAQVGCRHAEELVAPDAVSLLEDLTYFYDEPFADSSAIPTFLVARLARRSVKVVLSGDGGDEAFGGYSRYAHDLREARLRSFLPGWFRRAAIAPLAHIWPQAGWLPRPLRARTALTNLSLDAAGAYANTLTMCRSPLRPRLLAPDISAALNGYAPERLLHDAFTNATSGDTLAGMLTVDSEILLPDDFLVKVDRASMAHGLEARPPLLDHEVLELAARIPSDLKVRNHQTKWIFKQAFRGSLPDRVIRRPKQGFEIPTHSWLRDPLREVFEDTVLSSRARIAGLVDQAVARDIFRSFLDRRSRSANVLWGLLVLAHWAERYLGTPSASDSSSDPRCPSARTRLARRPSSAKLD
jgi:asparagine synthase (glutamine-hydrolysing)